MLDPPRLLSVNLATERSVPYRGREVRTGIYKEPAGGRVRLRTLGLDGDFQADPSVHGGPDKAVYVYPSEHYPYFREPRTSDLSAGSLARISPPKGFWKTG
jgi:MOSC domain-containing protein YiiM